MAWIRLDVGFSLVAMACDHSSCRPYWLTTVWGPLAVVAYWVVPSSPSSHGLQTSTDHSSLAFWSTRPLLEVKLKLPVAICGSLPCTGTQFAPPGFGSLANATLRTWVTPLETVVPTPVKSAGRPISQIAAAQATTIHSVPSMARVARLRTRPFQAIQIAPRMMTGARYGK